MFDQDNGFREDPLRVGRGIVIGLALGSLMWAGIIALVVYWIW